MVEPLSIKLMTRKRVNQIDILSPNPKKSHQKTINSGRHNFVVIKLTPSHFNWKRKYPMMYETKYIFATVSKSYRDKLTCFGHVWWKVQGTNKSCFDVHVNFISMIRLYWKFGLVKWHVYYVVWESFSR